MRVAALYDIHGNLPALEAVLADLEHPEIAVDEIVVVVTSSGTDAIGVPRAPAERGRDVPVGKCGSAFNETLARMTN